MFLWVLFCLFCVWAVLVLRAVFRHRRDVLQRVALRKQSMPHVVDPLLLLSAKQMAAAIKSGAKSSTDFVKCCISRIRQVNPALNALVRDRFDEALREAAEADRAVREGKKGLPAFHGVPCTIKEAFALKSMPQSAGLVSRAHVVATEDAVVVRQMREAGFIPLGVSNVSELCMWQESSNFVYGRTTSAYSALHTSGGSSGGEGALVGSCCSPVGLGSDIGGSIRMPAFFNGVFGHKPTAGLVSNRGQYPVTNDEGGFADLMLCTGPLVKRSEDLFPLLQVMCKDRNKLAVEPSAVNIKALRVYSMEKIGIWGLAPCPELIDAQRRVAEALKASFGCTVTTIEPFQGMHSSIEIWSTLLQTSETESFRTRLYGEGKGGLVRGLKELALWTCGMSSYTLPAIGLALLEGATKWTATPARIQTLERRSSRIRTELEELLGDDGVLLFPSFPTLPPKHNEPIYLPVKWIYTAIWNTLQVPVTQAPVGLDKATGLPLGVQIIGKRGCDHVTIAVAQALESIGVAGHSANFV